LFLPFFKIPQTI